MPRQRRSDLSPAFRSFANEWLRRYLSKEPHASRHASEVATALDIPEPPEDVWTIGLDPDRYFDVTKYIYNGGDEELLDVLHATIHVVNDGITRFTPPMPWVEVDRQLAYAHSIWTATKDGLEIRADPTAVDAFTEASAPADEASAQLQEAWANAYDRDGDRSDAWDHAIKAVEAILVPIVVPSQNKPTLGHVVSHLATQGHLWRLLLPGPDDDFSVAPLVAMLRLLWPNPDRHGSPQHRRAPTLEEAQAVVHLAVTIVQWGRDGQIVKR